MTTTVDDRPAPEGLSRTASWLRFSRGAALTMAVWSVALQVLAGVLIPPVAVIGAIFLVFVPFLTGERRRVGLALAVFAALALAGNVPILVDELAHPESSQAFILTLLSVLGALSAMLGGTAAFLRWKPAPIRQVVLGAAGVFAAGTMMSLVMASNTDSDVAQLSDTRVLAARMNWEPQTVSVSTGAVGVWVENEDGMRHTFTVEELGVDLEIPALRARRVDFEAPPGSYELICTVPGHEAMTGTLIVEG